MNQAINTLSAGIKKDFDYLIKYNPSKYKSIIDQISNKFPQDAPIFGKPNILINP